MRRRRERAGWRRLATLLQRGVVGTVTTTVVLCSSFSLFAPEAGAEGPVPSAPTNVGAVIGAQSATLRWSPPVGLGGLTVSYYLVTSVPSTQRCISYPSDIPPNTCTLSGLVPGTSYDFDVVAVTTVGTVSAAASVGPFVPVSAPAAPTFVTAVADGASLDVSWTPPTDAGGSSLTSSTATAFTPTGTTVASCSAAAPASSCVVQGLARGGSYYVSVTATNAAGITSRASNPTSIVSLVSAPSPPTDVIATPVAAGAVVTWSAPADDGGRAITSYTATAYDESTSVSSCTADPTSSGPLGCAIESLVNGTTYTIKVTASNDVGTSQPSLASSEFTPEIGDPASFTDFVDRLVKNSNIDVTATGATYELAVPPTSRVFGISLTGSLTVYISGPNVLTINGTVTLPDILGGATGSLAAAFNDGTLVSLSIRASDATIGKLFRVDHVELVYGASGWVVDGKVTDASKKEQGVELTGGLSISNEGKITGGNLGFGGVSLAGLVRISSFSISYESATKWAGGIAFEKLLDGKSNGSGASVDLEFGRTGRLVAGSVAATGPLSIFKVIQLDQFGFSYSSINPHWEATLVASRPSTLPRSTPASSVHFALSQSNGSVTGATFSLQNVAFGTAFSLKSATFRYSNLGPTQIYHVDGGVELPGVAGTTIQGNLQITNGVYQSGEIRASNLSVPFGHTGVFLQSISAAVDAPQGGSHWRIAGSVGLSFGPSAKGRTIFELTGGLSHTFPSVAGQIGTYVVTGEVAVGGVTLGSGTLTISDNPLVSIRVVLGEGDGTRGLAIGTYAHAIGTLDSTFSAQSFNLSSILTIQFAGFESLNTLHINGTGLAFCTTFDERVSGVEWRWGSPPQLVGSTCSTAGF